jgi:hypothetical protein
MADPVLALQNLIKSITEITAVTGVRVYRIGSVPNSPQTPYILLPGTISDIGDALTSTSDNGHARVQVSVFADTDVIAENLSQILKKKVPCRDAILLAGTDFLRVMSIEDAGASSDVNTDVKIYIRHRDFRIYYAY